MCTDTVKMLVMNRFHPVRAPYKNISRQAFCCAKRSIRLTRYYSKGQHFYWFCLSCHSVTLDQTVHY